MRKIFTARHENNLKTSAEFWNSKDMLINLNRQGSLNIKT
jgi:hypothetical protein